MYDLSNRVALNLGPAIGYRWLPDGAPYAPNSPWPGTGRFDDGETKTLYLAESAGGAVAEFLRRNPEFLDPELQRYLLIRVFEVVLNVVGPCLDIREPAYRAAIAFDWAQSLSADPNDATRYQDSGALAKAVIGSGDVGIAYPSAAATWTTWNLVLFGEPAVTTWMSDSYQEVERPSLAAAEVVILV